MRFLASLVLLSTLNGLTLIGESVDNYVNVGGVAVNVSANTIVPFCDRQRIKQGIESIQNKPFQGRFFVSKGLPIAKSPGRSLMIISRLVSLSNMFRTCRSNARL